MLPNIINMQGWKILLGVATLFLLELAPITSACCIGHDIAAMESAVNRLRRVKRRGPAPAPPPPIRSTKRSPTVGIVTLPPPPNMPH